MKEADENVESPHHTRNWIDLMLYLLVGMGSFIVVSSVISLQFEEVSSGVTFLLVLANFVCLGGTTYLIGIRRGRISWAELGLRPFRWRWEWLFIGVALALGLLPVRGVLGLVVQLVLEGNLDSLQARSDVLTGGALAFSWTGFGLMLLGVGILVPISEELYFRGLLHTWFWRATPLVWLRVLLSAAIFSLAHYDSVSVIAASSVIGVVNAIAYERTKSLAIPIIIHMTTNSAATVLLYLALALLQIFPGLA